jgi:DhnA family fructose-bisphosphate aldolase class Ia
LTVRRASVTIEQDLTESNKGSIGVGTEREGEGKEIKEENRVAGKDVRLGRLLGEAGRAVVIAVDHGFFDGPITGMENLPDVLARGIDPSVDAVLLSPGMLKRCPGIFSGRGGPMAIVRLNWATHYCFGWDYREAETEEAFTAEEAVALGADAVLVSLTLKTGSEARDAHNVAVFRRAARGAEKLGLPVVGEYFPRRPNDLSAEELHEEVKAGCRILAELGADLIKSYHTFRFRDVAGGCPVPILCLGAEKTKTQLDALRLAARQMADGAKGVVFGRNAIQRPDPPRFQRALVDVVKGMAPEAAAEKHGLKD